MSTNPYEPPRTEDEGIATSEPLDCPAFGQPMSARYLPSFNGIQWRDKPHRLGLLYSGNALPGTLPSFFGLGVNNVPAFRCTGCELVLFRYGSAAKHGSLRR